MNKDQFDKIECDKVSSEDIEDALEKVLLADTDKRPPSENRESTLDELQIRYKLQRRK